MKFNWKQTKQTMNNFFGRYDKKYATEDELIAEDIIRGSILDDNIHIKVVPIKNSALVDYLLVDEVNQVSISIEDRKITMCNHDYFYNDNFNLNFTDEMKKIIREHLEKERLELKKELFKNKINLLHKIKKIYVK